MKMFTRKVVVMLVVLCLLLALPISASAASTVSQDGLEITIATDKDDYSANEDIQVTVNIKNTNSYKIEDVAINTVLPEGLELKSGNLKTEKINIEAGATYSTEVVSQFSGSGSGGSTTTPEDTTDAEEPTTKETISQEDTTTTPEESSESKESAKNATSKADDPNETQDTTSPLTGDTSNLILWVILLVVSGTAVLVAVKHKKSIKIISLFLCVAMGISIIPLNVLATENNNTTITVDKEITVAGDTFNIKAKITYNSNKPSITLSNFESDEMYFMCGEENTITFTVEAPEAINEIQLIKNETEIVGIMHDDGLNGDKAENDSIYSFIITEQINSEDTIIDSYVAKYKEITSNAIFIYNVSDSDIIQSNKTVQEIDQTIKSKEASFKANGDDDEKINSSIEIYQEILNYLDTLKSNNEILNYTVYNNVITVRLLGCTYVYTFDMYNEQQSNTTKTNAYTNNTTNILEVNSKNNILTAQPYATELFTTVYDDAARLIENKIDTYSFSNNVDNTNVSINFLKNLSNYKVIIFDGHGGYSPELHSFIGTGENSNDCYNKYAKEMIGSMPQIIQLSGGSLGVTYKFFEKNYNSNSFDNTIWLMSCCHSSDDNVLADTLYKCGVKTFLGYKNSVYSPYARNMASSFFSFLSEYEDNNITKTAIDALHNAKQANGDTDPTDQTWWNKVAVFFGWEEYSEPAELRLIGNESFRLQETVGTLSGKICKASDRITAIPNAIIEVYKDSSLYTAGTSNSSGNYSINLPAGKYLVKISSDGYIDFKSYATVTDNENTYMETFLLIEGSETETGIASGKVINSLTGNGTSGVTLTIKRDWNNSNESDEVVKSVTTNENGNYSIELPLGNYTVNAIKDGYSSSSFNIIVQQGETGNQNGTITPIISGDNFLITLTWGENPDDLDSHVVGNRSDGSSFHVYFEEQSAYDGNVEVCNLDYDDTSSYGPEHITLNTTTDAPYYYYIYRYAGSGTVASSEAKITIEQDNNLIAEFNVPTDLGSEDYWNVFAIKNGELIVNNSITSSPNVEYAN